MSTKILDLEDKVVTDDGSVVFKYDFLVHLVSNTSVFSDFLVLPHHDLRVYNMRNPEHALTVWEDDNITSGPDKETFDWVIPEEYQKLDIVDLSAYKLKELGLTSEEYTSRLEYELFEMNKRGMFQFIRCVYYVVEELRKNNIVWGVGRGSSCASLVLFVLGINRVDPVKYNIPVGEFIK